MTDLVRTLTIGQNFLHKGVLYARLPEMNLRIGGTVLWVNCARVYGAPGSFEPERILAEYIHPDTHVVALGDVVGTDKLAAMGAADAPEPTVPAENFLGTLHANVDNWALGDHSFRKFVRDSLPAVAYPRPMEGKGAHESR